MFTLLSCSRIRASIDFTVRLLSWSKPDNLSKVTSSGSGWIRQCLRLCFGSLLLVHVCEESISIHFSDCKKSSSILLFSAFLNFCDPMFRELKKKYIICVVAFKQMVNEGQIVHSLPWCDGWWDDGDYLEQDKTVIKQLPIGTYGIGMNRHGGAPPLSWELSKW